MRMTEETEVRKVAIMMKQKQLRDLIFKRQILNSFPTIYKMAAYQNHYDHLKGQRGTTKYKIGFIGIAKPSIAYYQL
ncbi:hypothetical protein [Bacillus sp. JJ1773]|uniref:hypothetical protein n=1 Tax=Bacillus sp. JJ1773 TaxID=3122965 RepID=UPI002FFF86C5